MKKLFFVSLALTAFLFSCDDDDDDPVCTLSSSSIVGTYRTSAYTYKATPSSPEVDLFAQFAACNKDDLTIVKDNGTIVFQDAGTLCTPPDNDTVSYSLNGSVVTIDGDPGTISSFDCSTMVVTEDLGAGGVYTLRLARQ